MDAPFFLESQDSGTAAAPVCYTAQPGERPLFSGGQVLRGWKPGPGSLWSVSLPEAASGRWNFHQLFVNGQRRTRARSPNQGFYYISAKAPPLKDPKTGKTTPRDSTAFVFEPGQVKNWPDRAEADVVIFHSWETSRLHIADIDEANHVVSFTGPAAWPFQSWGPRQRFYIENVRAALDAPGEWYLEASSGTLLYYPLPGEDMRQAEVVAPRLSQLVELHGEPVPGRRVEHVTLRGLTFVYADWAPGRLGHSDPQAVVTAPAAFMADGTCHCTVENCEIAHVGAYGLWLRRGCQDDRVVHCRLFDLGAGTVRVGEAAKADNDEAESCRNRVDNNHLFDGGHVSPAGVGIWVAQSSHNTISHNEIHDFFYSGMSIGWNWDDAPNRCHHNVIEFNHVHHLVKGLLSDAGAIYTLGTSPGSVIRNNLFHDVWPYHSPPFGWGIYLDATCSGYRVENNVVYNTLSGGLMYNNGGHEHVIENNVFALSANHALWPYWEKRPNVFRHNIVFLTQGDLLIPLGERSLYERLGNKESLGVWDENVYWHTGGAEQLRFFRLSLPRWQALGLDRHSQVIDPRFVNAARYDFRLQADSPALRLGYRPIDLSQVGLYGDEAWVNEAQKIKYPPTVMPPPPVPPGPVEIDDDFEKTPVGSPPAGATVSGERNGASIRVTAEKAAGGKHSLKITDVHDLQPGWEPHFYYEPHLIHGTVRQSFDLRLEPGALLLAEWRDSTPYPRCLGPSVTFDGMGRVTVGGKVLTRVPVSRWVHVDIEAALGSTAPRTFRLTVVVPGSAPQVFSGLPQPGADFQELHWLGFSSIATVDSVFYIDNMKLKRLEDLK